MSALDELRMALGDAQVRVRTIERERQAAIDEAASAVRAQFAERHEAACRARSAAQVALDAAKEAREPHPWTGKKVVRKVTTGFRWAIKEETQFGIVETYTRATVLPGNAAGWRLPDYGSPIVRLLKKDGTPGAKIESFERGLWKLADDEGAGK